MGRIVTLTGPTGSGKTTIARRLLEFLWDFMPHMVTSLTTRQARSTDIPDEYLYVNYDTLRRMANLEKLMWIRQHGAYHYATTEVSVLKTLEREKSLGIMILVPSVIPNLRDFVKKRFGSLERLTSIAVVPPPPDILQIRMNRRGDPEILKDRQEDDETLRALVERFPHFYHFVENSGSLENTVREIRSLLQEAPITTR